MHWNEFYCLAKKSSAALLQDKKSEVIDEEKSCRLTVIYHVLIA